MKVITYDEASWRKGQCHLTSCDTCTHAQQCSRVFSAPEAIFQTCSMPWNNQLIKAGQRCNGMKRQMLFLVNIFLFSNFPIASTKPNHPRSPWKTFRKEKCLSFLTIKLQILCWKNILTHLSPSADIHTASPSPPQESDTHKRGQTTEATTEKGFTLQNKARSDRSALLLEFSGSKTFSLSIKCDF